MSGNFHIRLEQSDLSRAVLSCYAVVGNKRADKTLNLKIGQEHRYVMPDEMFDLATDYTAARRGHEDLLARVKELEEERQHLLVRPDSTLSHANAKMREQNDILKVKTKYQKAYEDLARRFLEEKLEDRNAKEVERIYKELELSGDGNKGQRVDSILKQFDEGTSERRFKVLRAANVVDAHEPSEERYSDVKAENIDETEAAQNAADVRRMSEELKSQASNAEQADKKLEVRHYADANSIGGDAEQADTRSYAEKKEELRKYKERLLELQDAAGTTKFKADKNLASKQTGHPEKAVTEDESNREDPNKQADDVKKDEKENEPKLAKSDTEAKPEEKQFDKKLEAQKDTTRKNAEKQEENADAQKENAEEQKQTAKQQKKNATQDEGENK